MRRRAARMSGAPHDPPSSFPWRRGQRSPRSSFFLFHKNGRIEPISDGQINIVNINMQLKYTLRLFVGVFTTAAQCWVSCAFAVRRNNVNGNLMVAMHLVWCHPSLDIHKNGNRRICNSQLISAKNGELSRMKLRLATYLCTLS